MKKKYILLAIVTMIILVVDQLTKGIILQQFRHGESVKVIENFFNITYVRNPGAAFGLFRTLEAGLRDWFFLLMPPVAMIIIFLMLRSTPNSDKIRKFALCAIFGGALGNFIDRVRFGYVVDFLDFHYYDFYSWPAFNVADISIVCGVTLLIIMEIVLMKQEWEKKKQEA